MTIPRFPRHFMILAVMALVSAFAISLASPIAAQVTPPTDDNDQEESEESETDDTDLPDPDDSDENEENEETDDTDLPDPDDSDENEENEETDDTDLPDPDDSDENETDPIRATVVRGNTLWGLSRTYLGSGFRWPEIFALNEGVVQADGRALTNPDLILIGWVLVIPR